MYCSRIFSTILIIFALITFSGCSPDSEAEHTKVVAQINDFQLTQDEFQKKLVQELEYSDAYKTTSAAKKEFLQSIIKKELLIQEAVELGLDKKRNFVSALEKYWEATLIKHLMEEKSREIVRTTTISDKDIKKEYDDLKAKNKDLPPFEQVEKEIANELFDAKKTALLNEWIASLYRRAEIDINTEFFNE